MLCAPNTLSAHLCQNQDQLISARNGPGDWKAVSPAVWLPMEAQEMLPWVTLGVEILRSRGQCSENAFPPPSIIVQYLPVRVGMPPHVGCAGVLLAPTAHLDVPQPMVRLACPWDGGNAAIFQQLQLPRALPQEMLDQLVVFSVDSRVSAGTGVSNLTTGNRENAFQAKGHVGNS